MACSGLKPAFIEKTLQHEDDVEAWKRWELLFGVHAAKEKQVSDGKGGFAPPSMKMAAPTS